MLPILLLAGCMAALVGVEGQKGHAECGALVSLPRRGELVSHKAFGKCSYPVGMDCTWEVEATASDPDTRLAFSFDIYELPLEKQPCERTYLKFHDRADTAEPVFKSLCQGRTIPEPFNSTSNKVKITLKTNDIGARGFIMKIAKFRICRPMDFQCSDGYCIKEEYKCDGVTGDTSDCLDGSDEVGCKELTCVRDQFRCAHKLRCIDAMKECDGSKDCRDNSDEAHCQEKTCTKDQFRCAHKLRCLKKNKVCDGVDDCGDKSDEADCTQKTCNGGQFRCANGVLCVPRLALCDGTQDCWDNSDEDGCAAHACNKGDFRCLNKKCVSPIRVCNVKDDCGDKSEEFGCPSSVTCNAQQFTCKIPRCVDSAVRCNMVDDCTDNSDEEGCLYTIPGGGPPCVLNHIFCPASKRCLSSALACNGVDDCGDNSDEQNCDGAALCKTPWHQCANTQYITLTKRCDGAPNCLDGSDEKGCESG